MPRMLLYAIIFISGAAILALELLASRIMTPYFGVSLYIWTSILSVTLVSLALGYWWGGRLAASVAPAQAASARLARLYISMPAIAAIGIVAACFTYPHLFSPLASSSLLAGAFIASLVLLFVPLVATSAMNPLLVALMLRSGSAANAADAGAGKVFTMSTIGSVAGVFITAFGLIPYISNFAAVLVVAFTLALVSLASTVLTPHAFPGRIAVGATALAGALLAVILVWNADRYTGRSGPYSYGSAVWRLEASFSSLFGTVKVLRSDPRADGRYSRMYYQDGLTQNTADSEHRSTSFYTYALEALARAYAPDMRNALVLGLGAGMVPMRLAQIGVPVDVVDIDPAAPRAAARFFGFDPRKARTHEADARTFLRGCKAEWHVIIVDLFHGDGTPDYLVTREFFRDLRQCLAPNGIAVFNTFADLESPSSYAHFLVTLRSELPHIALYRPPLAGSPHINSFVVAGAQPLRVPVRITIDQLPERIHDRLWAMLAGPVALTPDLFAKGRIVTDALNPAAHEYAQMQLIYRKTVIESTPPAMLMN